MITLYRICDADGVIETTTIWAEVIEIIEYEIEAPAPAGIDLETLRDNAEHYLGWTIETVEYATHQAA